MALSNNIISQFAKLTSEKKKDTGTSIKGTFKIINGKEYVQVDGSEILTPVTTNVEAVADERVVVLIKDHMATVTENITSPAARNKSVQNIKDEVDAFGNTIQQMDNTIIQQGNSIIEIDNTINQQGNTINQHDSKINQQGDEIISINNTILEQGNAIELSNNVIIEHGNRIDSMNNTIIEHGNNINSINNNITQQGNDIISINNSIIQYGNEISQMGDQIVSQGNDITLIGNKVNIQDSNITILNSGFSIINGVITGLSGAIIDSLKTNSLNAAYADIDFSNINFAAVQKLFTESGIIKDLIVDQGHITGELVGVTIKGDLIEGNTIKADKLVVLGADGIYYKLNIGAETVEAQQTEQNSLNGSIIAAKSITASKISVQDLVAFGATIAGFIIDQNSIHSGTKASIDSDVKGLYFDKDGQFYLGDSTDHVKYYKDETDAYVLDIRASKIYLGVGTKTINEQMDDLSSNFENVAPIFTPGSPLTYQDVVGGTFTSNKFTRSSSSGWSAGFRSVETFGNGKYVEFTVSSITSLLAFGLNSGTNDANYNTIDFCVYKNAANLSFYTNGTNKGAIGTVIVGDKIRLAIIDNVVIIFKNDTAIYKSTIIPTLPLYLDCSVSTASATVEDIVGGDFTPGSLLNQTSDALQSASNALEYAQLASNSASTANTAISDMASDSKLSPSEKQATKLEWDVILSERTINDTQATSFEIDTEKTTYDNAFQALATYLNNGVAWTTGTPTWLSNLTTTQTIVGTTFRDTFKTYYDARTTLLNAIAAKAKLLADTAQSDVNSTKSSIVDLEISSNAFQTTVLGIETQTNTTQDDLNSYKEEISTKFTQVNDQFNFMFTEQILPLIQNGDNLSQETLQVIQQYIQFVAGNIILGASNSNFSIKITNEKISFLQGLDNEIAFFSNNTLFIANAIIGKKVIIGDSTTPTKWQLDIDDVGNLNLGKAGD